MKIIAKQSKKPRLTSVKLALLLFVIITGVCQSILVANYYRALSSSSDNTVTLSDNIRNSTSIKPIIPPTATTTYKKTDVIVYLAQFDTHHSSYGAAQEVDAKNYPSPSINSTGISSPVSKLNKSLDLLNTNYISQHPADILIFYDYTHPPTEQIRIVLQKHYPHIQFRPLNETYWSLPYNLQEWQLIKWKRPAFSVGYRLMMRWFAILLWKYLDTEGYTHVMRLDDDSYILSPITFNIFDYMRTNNKRYGFRQPVYEDGGNHFHAVVNQYLIDKNPSSTSFKYFEDLYKKDRGVSFYNNFFIADISFFLSPPASDLLRIIDESKLIFTQRTGDLVIHSAVVRLFLPPNQIHWFRDFTYEHMTLCNIKGRPKCGPFVHRMEEYLEELDIPMMSGESLLLNMY